MSPARTSLLLLASFALLAARVEANDTCATATDAGSAGTFLDSGTTATASDDYDPNDCATSGFPGGNDVVYVLAPALDSTVHIQYTNLNDGVLYAATDCDDIAGTCLGADDGEVTETLDLDVGAGTVVYVICDSFFPGGGAYTISITFVPTGVGAPEPASGPPSSWGRVKSRYR